MEGVVYIMRIDIIHGTHYDMRMDENSITPFMFDFRFYI